MAFSLATALGPWRALPRALGICGLLFAAGTAAATPDVALASPAAALTAAVRPAASKAKKAARSKAKKASRSSRSSKGTRSGKATRTAKAHKATRASKARRSARTNRRSRANRPAPRPSADLHSAEGVTVPQVVLPELSLAATPGTGNPFTLITRSATSLLDGLVARARGQLGTRYVYGATDPDNALDCSSFARYVMEALGVRLPRTANQQARIGAPVPRDLTALRPGDLLTFGSRRHTSHVGIYLGQGRFIHASVKSGQVIETTIDRNRSLFRRWQGARRLLAGAVDSLPLVGAPAAGAPAVDELSIRTSGG